MVSDRRANEGMKDQREHWARTIGSRFRQISSRHEGILEHLGRTDKLVAGKNGSLESTMQKTVKITERAWNKAVKF